MHTLINGVIISTAVAYLFVGGSFLFLGKFWNGMVWFGYAAINFFLLMSMRS